jgi:hypothetical protein
MAELFNRLGHSPDKEPVLALLYIRSGIWNQDRIRTLPTNIEVNEMYSLYNNKCDALQSFSSPSNLPHQRILSFQSPKAFIIMPTAAQHSVVTEVSRPLSKAALRKLDDSFDSRTVHFVVDYEKSEGNWYVWHAK